MSKYMEKAKSDAVDMVSYFSDEIYEQLIADGKASTDLFNDYPNGDEYHHTAHVDKHYTLLEAAQILDEIKDYEETDAGLWARTCPREAIKTQAAYTYANAVRFKWLELISEINDDAEIQEALEVYNNWDGSSVDYGSEDEVVDYIKQRIDEIAE